MVFEIAAITGPSARLSKANRRARAGFTFLEVLFAVIILGIGFIMLAAMFPVAIQQQRASVDDSMSPTIGTSAMAELASIFRSVDTLKPASGTNIPMLSDLMPATGDTQNAIPVPLKVSSFRDPRFNPANKDRLWSLVAGCLINTTNPAYAFVPFYMRDANATTTPPLAGTARLIVIVVKAKNKQTYSVDDVTAPSTALANLEPYLVRVSVDSTLTPNQLTMTTSTSIPNSTIAAAATGSFILVSDDASSKGASNGFYFQLGNLISSSGGSSTWELVPGRDLSSYPPGVNVITNADAFYVGMAPDPVTPSQFTGTSQELGVFNGLISLPRQ